MYPLTESTRTGAATHDMPMYMPQDHASLTDCNPTCWMHTCLLNAQNSRFNHSCLLHRSHLHLTDPSTLVPSACITVMPSTSTSLPSAPHWPFHVSPVCLHHTHAFHIAPSCSNNNPSQIQLARKVADLEGAGKRTLAYHSALLLLADPQQNLFRASLSLSLSLSLTHTHTTHTYIHTYTHAHTHRGRARDSQRNVSCEFVGPFALICVIWHTFLWGRVASWECFV